MFTWRAIYKDKSVHNYKSGEYQIDNVDQARLDMFQIIDEGSDIPTLTIHFDDKRKRLIYVRRSEMTTTLPYPIICHLCGWQMKVGSENVQALFFVFETVIVDSKANTTKHYHWMETTGKYDRKRDSHFYQPTPKQLKIIGSNPL